MYDIGPFKYTFKITPYSETQPKTISCDEHLEIKKNELVVIAGPSGGGKSTLLALMKGLLPEFGTGHLEGSILYKKVPLSGEGFQKNLKSIVFLFQNPFSQLIYPDAAEEFFFSMENFNYTKDEMERRKNELQNIFNLEVLWSKKTNELSHGECQRLVLASLLAVEPEVLLLDEPTAFLDPEARQDFYRWLKRHKGKRTIVIVDHHVNEIVPIADKILQVNSLGVVSAETPIVFQSFPKENSSITLSISASEENITANSQINLQNISFHYPGQKELLKNISLSVSGGSIVVIKGRNGKGKSTLFKIMAGLLKPGGGKVAINIDGLAVNPKLFYKETGFVFQNPESHFFYDTINEELQSCSKTILKKNENLLNTFLKEVDLDRSPFLLSEGEKRRISILITVFQNKRILFYDEPTFGQDHDSKLLIQSLILELKKEGKIQFIISHDDDWISSLGADVYELVDYHLTRLL
jgi:energy-coupling factor transporter ATP-binding protein EcfA2